MHKKLLAAAGLICFAWAQNALAYDWAMIGVHVTVVESTYMPNKVTLQIDSDAGNCKKGTWLTYNSTVTGDSATQQANVKATFALLLAAKINVATVNLFGVNSGCVVQFVHMQ